MALVRLQTRSLARWWLTGCLAATLCAIDGLAQSPPPAATEEELRAVFLLHLARFVRWPDDALGPEQDPLVIGVLGDERLLRKLARAVDGERIGARRIVSRSVQSPPEISRCHMVFIHRNAMESAAPFIAEIHDLPVLLVSDSDGFLKLGGHVQLTRRAGQLRLRVDPDNIASSHLVASSQLLRFAEAQKPPIRRK